MRTEIRQLHNKLKTTTIYVTHDQIEAMTMADQIVVMRAGKIEQMGTPDQVYDTPASKYVADFIGSAAINFIEGTVVAGSGVPAVDVPGGRVMLAPNTAVQPGQRVILGLRPTDVTVQPDGPIRGKTLLLERMGHDAQLCAQYGDRQFLAIVDKAQRFDTGADVAFGIAPEKVHVFDATTEKRL